MGRDDTHELWRSTGSLYLLRLMGGSLVMLKMMVGVDRSSNILVIRCLMRSFRPLVPEAEPRQCGVIGRADKLCPASRKRSLMENFEDR
jgi:hypothetical protein